LFNLTEGKYSVTNTLNKHKEISKTPIVATSGDVHAMQNYNTCFPHISIRITGGTECQVFSQLTMLWLTFLIVGVL